MLTTIVNKSATLEAIRAALMASPLVYPVIRTAEKLGVPFNQNTNAFDLEFAVANIIAELNSRHYTIVAAVAQELGVMPVEDDLSVLYPGLPLSAAYALWAKAQGLSYQLLTEFPGSDFTLHLWVQFEILPEALEALGDRHTLPVPFAALLSYASKLNGNPVTLLNPRHPNLHEIMELLGENITAMLEVTDHFQGHTISPSYSGDDISQTYIEANHYITPLLAGR